MHLRQALYAFVPPKSYTDYTIKAFAYTDSVVWIIQGVRII